MNQLNAIPMPSLDYLHEAFALDQATGELTWKTRPVSHFSNAHRANRSNSQFSGKRAGNLTARGYLEVGVGGKSIRLHRIVFFMATGINPGGQMIDHADGDRLNNRPENLRLATREENGRNRYSSSARSGHRGVSYHRKTGKWQARIRIDGKEKSLGLFNDIETASAVAKQARDKEFGAFAGGAK
jgi:hypothetical protein